MSYIYDSFEWSHCTGQHSIKALMATLRAEYDAKVEAAAKAAADTATADSSIHKTPGKTTA
jgi:hypothetical protein